MRIGFDAKRAFFNTSGLGNYSRDTIAIMSEYFPMNEYILFTPRPNKSVFFHRAHNLCIEGPKKFWHKKFPAYWRSYKMNEQLMADGIELFHGLSNELPFGIEKSGIPSVVTIHDLIFMRYPNFYSNFDRRIYEKKFSYAAQNANLVIAVSQQTATDLQSYFGIPGDKIEVVYQGCNRKFWETVGAGEKAEISMKYAIPDKFILYVGTIEERKNLLKILEAMHIANIDVPLVAVGKATEYFARVKAYAEQKKMHNVFFLQNVTPEDLPALYQMAELFVYPSIFEGFGIPIIEALTSKVPVITSKGGCFHEAGGKSSLYIDPTDTKEIAEAMKAVLSDSNLHDRMAIDGYAHAIKFRHDNIAQNLMKAYEKIY